MKSAFLLSCLLAGGSMLGLNLTNTTSNRTTTALPALKETATKRDASAAPIAPVRIVVDKSDYELHVYDSKGWFATYPVVFGNDPLKDKKMEGDRCTPEGTFHIISKRYHEKWHRFLALDYPNKEALDKFNQRKQKGEIPKTAKPGGAIGIHGTWPDEDFVVDRYKNWTLGCISMKNSDVQELYKYIEAGTPITIKK
jgi:murein L,D-transpeptidase YafK